MTTQTACASRADINHARECARRINAVRRANGMAPIDASVGKNGAIISKSARPGADVKYASQKTDRVVSETGHRALVLWALSIESALTIPQIVDGCAELELTRRQVKRALRGLHDDCLIAREIGRYAARYRLTVDGAKAQKTARVG